jgi:N-acetylneuraminate synthase
VFIIAEAGVNHNGDPKLASKLVDVAVEAGADAVKFQTFKAENVVTKTAVRAEYQKKTTCESESQFAMLKKLELTHETHHDLLAHCKVNGIEFLSTAFDDDSLNFLINDLGLTKLKIPSGEITNGPFLLAHALTGSDLIISTGMAELDEVEKALGVMAYGLIHCGNSKTKPSQHAFQEAYLSVDGKKLLQEKVTLLHCTSEYPALPEDINLNAMVTMRDTLGIKTGYSDHSQGTTVAISAATLGASVIEKHFTLDQNLPGPDHKASLEPSQLKEMVLAIRAVEKLMGDGIKVPQLSELKNLPMARKSLVAAKEIKKGDLFTEDNLTIKRPGTGKSPMDYWDTLDMQSEQDYKPDEVIS